MLNPAGNQRGISLTELMVSLSIGVLLMLGLTTFMSGTTSSNASSIKTIQFNQELRAAMTLMVRDIRRSGYWGSPNYTTGALSGVGYGTGYSNPFSSLDNSTAGCILYRYDKNGNGTLENGEYFGFQLSGTGIQMLTDGTNSSACGGSTGWTPLTNTKNLKIVDLSFSYPRHPHQRSTSPRARVPARTSKCAT